MHYTLNQIQIFLKVVEAGSITKAAESLHLTQPAVSIQLKNFQDQFEIPLTEVVGRKLYVTAFGNEIAAAARRILEQVHAIDYMTQAYKGQLFGQIKIAVVSTGKYVMPYFISGFMKEHPNLELEMDVSNKLRVIESIQKNEVDLALVSVLPENLNVEKVDLIVNKLYLIGGTTSSGSSKEDKKTNFEGMPLLYREKGSGTRQSMERFIEKKRIMVNKRMELTSNEAVKQAIIAGLGISIVPLIGIQNEIKNGQLKILPVKGLPLKTTWSLIWPKGKQHSPATAAFLSYLEKHKHDIIHKQFGWYQQFQ